MPDTARRVVLASRPIGEPKDSDFRLEEFPVPRAEPGQMLLRTRWLSLDPYMRGRMSDAPSYAKPVGIGEVMEGGTVSEVMDSKLDGFGKGDLVVGRTGWQTHAVSNGKGLRKVDAKSAPISTALGVLGMPGMTAYTGLLEIGQPKEGETVGLRVHDFADGAAFHHLADADRLGVGRRVAHAAPHVRVEGKPARAQQHLAGSGLRDGKLLDPEVAVFRLTDGPRSQHHATRDLDHAYTRLG